MWQCDDNPPPMSFPRRACPRPDGGRESRSFDREIREPRELNPQSSIPNHQCRGLRLLKPQRRGGHRGKWNRRWTPMNADKDRPEIAAETPGRRTGNKGKYQTAKRKSPSLPPACSPLPPACHFPVAFPPACSYSTTWIRRLACSVRWRENGGTEGVRYFLAGGAAQACIRSRLLLVRSAWLRAGGCCRIWADRALQSGVSYDHQTEGL